MGELHLDIIVDRMKREFKVEANIGAPQVAYRETILGSAEMEYIHKKQSGGAGQFAKVKLSVEPLEAGKGREIENLIKGGAIPKEYIPGVEKGVEVCLIAVFWLDFRSLIIRLKFLTDYITMLTLAF